MQQDQIIDCDGHLLEPPNLWQRYLEGGLRAKALRLVADRNGGTRTLSARKGGEGEYQLRCEVQKGLA